MSDKNESSKTLFRERIRWKLSEISNDLDFYSTYYFSRMRQIPGEFVGPLWYRMQLKIFNAFSDQLWRLWENKIELARGEEGVSFKVFTARLEDGDRRYAVQFNWTPETPAPRASEYRYIPGAHFVADAFRYRVSHLDLLWRRGLEETARQAVLNERVSAAIAERERQYGSTKKKQ